MNLTTGAAGDAGGACGGAPATGATATGAAATDAAATDDGAAALAGRASPSFKASMLS